jgi:UDPglucose 6-dehydrogenase
MAGADISFIAVGTLTRASDGYADLSQVHAAVEDLVPFLKAGAIVGTKSTVPVGTGDTIEYLIGNIRPELDFGVASNPEFLRAGRAVQDFLQPDRVVIGAESDLAAAHLTKLYRSTRGMGLDERIGSRYLQPGPGLRCILFPKGCPRARQDGGTSRSADADH